MKKIISALICAVLLTLTSCRNWLDVNRDPNAVSTVESGLIVPAAELALITNYGMYANMLGSFFSDQWGVKPNGPNCFFLAQWDSQVGNMPEAMADRLYTYSYVRTINNLKAIRESSKTTNAGDYLVATVLRDFNYQVLVDLFGETPYAEAENINITAPRYDEGKDVYANLTADLEEALTLVKESGATTVCDNMLFNSDKSIDNWIEFANALLLRMYMRESDKVDVSAKIDALISNDSFPQDDICFNSNLFSNEAGKENPLYNNFVRSIGDPVANRSMDLVAHMCAIGTMGEYGDPRISAKFKPSVKYNNFEGNFICSQQSVEVAAKYVDKDGFAEPILNYNTPVYLITVADTEFLLAEYYLKKGDAANSKEHYEAAIKASFRQCGLNESAAAEILAGSYAWDSNKGLELIGIQKWIANTGINGFESWCEMRRLGYPEINGKSGAEAYTAFCNMAKENITASKPNPTPTCKNMVDAGYYSYGKIFSPTISTGLPQGSYIQRMPYSTTSKKTNGNAPALKAKTDKIFWAK